MSSNRPRDLRSHSGGGAESPKPDCCHRLQSAFAITCFQALRIVRVGACTMTRTEHVRRRNHALPDMNLTSR